VNSPVISGMTEGDFVGNAKDGWVDGGCVYVGEEDGRRVVVGVVVVGCAVGRVVFGCRGAEDARVFNVLSNMEEFV